MSQEEFLLFLKVLAQAALDHQMSDQNLEYHFRIRSEELGFNLSRLRVFQIFYLNCNNFLLIVLKEMIVKGINSANLDERWKDAMEIYLYLSRYKK